jgi:hypothetical protein
MADFKDVLSEWGKEIIFGLNVEDCPSFLFKYYDLLDDSYIQYYLLYLASQGLYSKEVLKLSSEELYTEITIIFKGVP